MYIVAFDVGDTDLVCYGPFNNATEADDFIASGRHNMEDAIPMIWPLYNGS